MTRIFKVPIYLSATPLKLGHVLKSIKQKCIIYELEDSLTYPTNNKTSSIIRHFRNLVGFTALCVFRNYLKVSNMLILD